MKTKTRFVWQDEKSLSRCEYTTRTIPVIPPVGCDIIVKLPLGDDPEMLVLVKVQATVTETSIDYTRNEIMVRLEDISD